MAAGSALVTGAGSGIGAATARRLGAAGFAVLCADINAEAAEQTARVIRDAGGQAQSCGTDVADDSQCARAVAVAESLGPLRAVCNIAGVGAGQSGVLEVEPDVWDRVLAVNLRSVYSTARHAARGMRERGYGVILNTASVHAFAAQRHSAPYAAAKGAIVALTRQLAMDLTQHGIRVVAVAPGSVNTPMSAPSTEALAEQGFLSSPNAVGRVAEPDELAAVFEWLCSDAASFVNGTTIVADGGLLAGLGTSWAAE